MNEIFYVKLETCIKFYEKLENSRDFVGIEVRPKFWVIGIANISFRYSHLHHTATRRKYLPKKTMVFRLNAVMTLLDYVLQLL